MIVIAPVFLLLIISFVLGLALLCRRWRHAFVVKIAAIALWLLLATLSAFAFHDRFRLWRGCFNELGRCYDPETSSIMVEQAGPIWGTLTLLFALLSLSGLWRLLRQRTAPPGP